MYIYICILMLIGICTILFTNDIKEKANEKYDVKNIVFYMIVILLIAVQSLRTNKVGGDLINYGYRFTEFGSMNWKDIFFYRGKHELGYVILNKIIYLVTNGNFQALLFVIATFYNFSLASFLRKKSSNYFLSLYLYIALNIFNLSMNNLRTTIALGILYIGIPFLMEKKYMKFLITLALACLFHASMVCMLFFFCTVIIKSNYIVTVLCVMCSVFLGVGFPRFSKIILMFFPKYASYFEGNTSGGGRNLLMFLMFLIVTLMLFSKKNCWKDDSKKIFLKMLVCGMCLQMVSLNISFFARAVYYHLTSILILYPDLISNGKFNKKSSFIFMLIIMSCFFGYYIFALKANSTMTVPYESIVNFL